MGKTKSILYEQNMNVLLFLFLPSTHTHKQTHTYCQICCLGKKLKSYCYLFEQDANLNGQRRQLVTNEKTHQGNLKRQMLTQIIRLR